MFLDPTKAAAVAVLMGEAEFSDLARRRLPAEHLHTLARLRGLRETAALGPDFQVANMVRLSLASPGGLPAALATADLMRSCRTGSQGARFGVECLAGMSAWRERTSAACTERGAEVSGAFHMLWSGGVTAPLMAALASFRLTQRDYAAGLTLWLYGRGAEEAVARVRKDPAWQKLQRLEGPAVELRPLGPEELSAMARRTVWERPAQEALRRFFELRPDDARPGALADFLRLFLLERLGGVYVDADVLFLASWRPLLCGASDFAYEWGPDRYLNTAVLRVAPGSRLGPCLARAVVAPPQADIPNPFHPGDLSRLAHEQCSDGLAMLPCEVFDPYWIYQYGRDLSSVPPWMAGGDGAPADGAPAGEAFGRACRAQAPETASADAVRRAFGSGALALHLHLSNCGEVEPGSWLEAAMAHVWSRAGAPPGDAAALY